MFFQVANNIGFFDFVFHFLTKNLVFWAILLAKNSKNTEKNVEKMAFLGAETGGLEAGGLEAGGLEARATDFGAGPVLTCLGV